MNINLRNSILVFMLGLGLGYSLSTTVPVGGPTVVSGSSAIETAFSPNQGASDLVVKTVNSAKSSVRVASYSFTSQPIADALIDAHNRGVDVKIVADGSNRKEKGSKVRLLRENGIPVRLNDQFAIMHDKFIIIDDQTVELGSFNYTYAAEHKNAENVLVFHDVPEIAARYQSQWESIYAGGQQE